MESEWRYRLNRWTISMVDRVVAVSKEVGEFCISHIRLPAQKVVVIHNGVEIPSLRIPGRRRGSNLDCLRMRWFVEQLAVYIRSKGLTI